MFHLTNIFKYLTPIQTLVLGYSFLILLGVILLLFPFSATTGHSINVIDALFTSTSAVTTTGLVVLDTGSDFSKFGQMVILLLFQIGGLGYMIFYALTILTLGGKLSLGDRILLKESLSRLVRVDIITFIKIILIFTIFIELMGSILLTLYWMNEMSLPNAIYTAVFHSVSAFCTAGFSLFSDSFTAAENNLFVNLTVCGLCILGGIGFFVLFDLSSYTKNRILKKYPCKLTVHSKLTLFMTVLLIIIGTIILWISEFPITSGSFYHRSITSIFQAVSASSTTGFNSINIGVMSMTSLFMIILLMIIGASPGSTGGGVKNTSVGILTLYVLSQLSNKKEINLYYHKIPPDIIKKAITIISLAFSWITLSMILLTFTEHQDFLKSLFEIVSALGTVGLSTGITPELTLIGKLMVTITMFIGRVGPLAIGLSLIGRKKRIQPFQYTETDILVG